MDESKELTSKDIAIVTQPVDDEQGEEEFDFPYLKIPNGIPSEEEHRYWLSKENEPSEDELRDFFQENPDALERLVACQQINNDVTDSWGLEGYEPGYIFVVGKKYEGKQTIADETFLRRALNNPLQTESGVSIPQIPSYDEFPQNKYMAQLITTGRTPNTYRVVNELIHTPKPLAIEH